MNTVPVQKPLCVVDDDEFVRSGTVSLLRSEGYEAESFDSAEAFLQSGEPGRFACIISDIQMPGMSGIELANALRRAAPATPVVLVTARTEPDLLAKAQNSSAVRVLRKPFAAEQLLDCVRVALG